MEPTCNTTLKGSGLVMPDSGQPTTDLSSHSFFQIFKSLDPAALVTPETTKMYPAGEVVFKQYDPPDGAYLVLSGHVAATVVDPLTGEQIEVARFTKGSFFGEYGALDGGQRSATMTARFNSELACVPGEILRNLLKDPRPRDEMLAFVRNAIDAVAAANDSFVQQAAQAGIGLAVAQLAHNIKNPLTIFTMAPDMLRDKNESSQIGRLADQITNRGRRIGGLIDGLMALSRDPLASQRYTSQNSTKEVAATPQYMDSNSISLVDELAPMVANNTFFSVFSSEDPNKHRSRGELMRFKEGDVMFVEGERSSDAYLHLRGGPIEIVRAGRSGKPITVARIEAGEFFGHYGVFRGGTRIAMARATTDSEALKIQAADFCDVIEGAGNADLICLMRHIIKDARLGNLHYAHQNRLVEIMERTQGFAAQVMPIIDEIQGLLRDLRGMDTLNDPTSLVGKMDRELQRIRTVIHDLEVCSSGDPKPTPTTLNASEIFDELNTSFADTFKKSAWSWDIASVSKDVWWDKEQILSVLENLVKNAKEAIESQPTPIGSVRVTAEDLDNRVRIKVSDNGPGLPDVIKSHPFEMFLTRCKLSGTGLGLAMCKTIVEAHGGTIRFDDNPDGHGTLFTIELPCHPNFAADTATEQETN